MAFELGEAGALSSVTQLPIGSLETLGERRFRLFRRMLFPRSTLTLADGKLIIMTGQGELVVAEASPDEYKELARAQVLTPGNDKRDGCWTMPILVGGRIYCRSIEKGKSVIICLDVSAK